MNEIMLEVSGLNIYKKETGEAIVRNLGFTLSAGETLGIVGESGSGKTVTLKSLIGLLPKTLHDSHDIKKCDVRMAMIFQDPVRALDPLCPVVRQITEIYMANHRMPAESGSLAGALKPGSGIFSRIRRLSHGAGTDREKLKEEACDWTRQILKRLRLPEDLIKKDRLPSSLSGGQCQRVCIAMALACEPGLLLCDEPTTALDASVKKKLLLLLKELQAERGFGMIFVTHDLAAASMVCDRLIVMKDGRIIEEGTAEEILEHPSDEYTRTLSQAVLRV